MPCPEALQPFPVIAPIREDSEGPGGRTPIVPKTKALGRILVCCKASPSLHRELESLSRRDPRHLVCPGPLASAVPGCRAALFTVLGSPSRLGWTSFSTSSNDQRDLYRLIGASTLSCLVGSVLRKNAEHRALAFTALHSHATASRVLFATGLYQDVPGCPFFGIEAPEAGDFLQVRMGAVMVSTEHGMLRLRTWFAPMFVLLAEAAIKAFDLTPNIIAPKKPTKLADLRVSQKRNRPRSGEFRQGRCAHRRYQRGPRRRRASRFGRCSRFPPSILLRDASQGEAQQR
ncbi:hypothetical protein DFH09DRAFT_1374637 [Mycena vulgaris]|nr:hypothetical protein DFH09DRAFT_1374637 [Mycena vulgaris]